MTSFSDLSAVYLNASLKRHAGDSHTKNLMDKSAAIMRTEGVSVEFIHMLDHRIGFGMVADAVADNGADHDDWPPIQERILAADILVLGTPIWLGVKSSLATLAIERMYAHSGERNEKGQYLYYGKTAGCVVTGNEDGVKAVAMETLYAFQHIGFWIPPQADCGWIGEAGPGPSYGDQPDGGGPPIGYDNDFTNRNTTIMTWNLMHAARVLRDIGGFPAKGNVAMDWQSVTNAGMF